MKRLYSDLKAIYHTMKPETKKERIRGLEELCNHLFRLIRELQADIAEHEATIKKLKENLK